MNELATILKAREFAKEAGVDHIPVDIQRYLVAANAQLSIKYDLEDAEAGRTIPLPNRWVIEVNGNHIPERQRFTVLHEIGHIVLNLPSAHKDHFSINSLHGYSTRPREEILCDVFAAECLLPFQFFRKDVAETEPGMDSVKRLASKYEASLISTASRYAANSDRLCASVLSEDEVVRYVSTSPSLREAGFWVDIGIHVPKGSVMGKVLVDSSIPQFDEISAYHWTNKDTFSGCVVSEEVVLVSAWNQAIGLLWFEEGEGPSGRGYLQTQNEEDELLPELDGTLPWPSRRKRK